MFIRKSSPFRHFIVSFSQKVINFSATLVKTRHRFVFFVVDRSYHCNNLYKEFTRVVGAILDGVDSGWCWVEGGLGFEIGV